MHSDGAEIIAQRLGEDTDLRLGSQREFSSPRGGGASSRDCNRLALDLEEYRKLFHVLTLSPLDPLRAEPTALSFSPMRAVGIENGNPLSPSVVTRKSRLAFEANIVEPNLMSIGSGQGYETLLHFTMHR
jgi:hypothetical protein